MTSLIRKNLMTRETGYSPYCGGDVCRASKPRTRFNGKQFVCPCGWESQFDKQFIFEYRGEMIARAVEEFKSNTYPDEISGYLEELGTTMSERFDLFDILVCRNTRLAELLSRHMLGEISIYDDLSIPDGYSIMYLDKLYQSRSHNPAAAILAAAIRAKSKVVPQ